MLGHWFSTNAPICKYIFPIVGHSFHSPDRVFGCSEKVTKRMATILKEFIEIFWIPIQFMR